MGSKSMGLERGLKFKLADRPLMGNQGDNLEKKPRVRIVTSAALRVR
jgi:hypothetical protein